jgi:hypothetical protein
MSVSVPVVDTWDGVDRRIYLKSGVTEFYPIEDLYREYRNQRRLDEGLRKFDPLLRAEGHINKGGGKYTPRYVVLLDGTKIVPYDESGEMSQLGEIITDDPEVDPDVYDVTSLSYPKVVYVTPAEAEVIEISTGSGVTQQDKDDIINGVLDEIVTGHTGAGSVGDYLIEIKKRANQAAKKLI